MQNICLTPLNVSARLSNIVSGTVKRFEYVETFHSVVASSTPVAWFPMGFLQLTCVKLVHINHVGYRPSCIAAFRFHTKLKTVGAFNYYDDD